MWVCGLKVRVAYACTHVCECLCACTISHYMSYVHMEPDPFKHKTSSLEKKVSHPVADATGSSLPVTEPQEVVSDIEGTGDECDGNYNYVSWDIVNQPIAAGLWVWLCRHTL